MKNSKGKNMAVITLVCSVIGISSMSFQDTPKIKIPLAEAQINRDTPQKNNLNLNIDFKELTAALAKINIELNGTNLEKLAAEISITLDSIDVDKIKSEVNQSLRSVDWEKIKYEINTSLKDINIEGIKLSLQKAADDIKININSEEFKKSLQQLKKTDTNKIKKAQEDIQNNKDTLHHDINKIKSEGGKENVNKARHLVEDKKADTFELPEKNRFFFVI